MIDSLQAILITVHTHQVGGKTNGGALGHMKFVDAFVLLLRPFHPENPDGTETARPVCIRDF